MRGVAQRVSSASVTVDGHITGEIGRGILLFVGVGLDDDEKDADYLLHKTVNLRVFEDEDGKMNRSLINIGGGLLIVSQFTLHGDARKGMRPSFIKAADPKHAERLYEYFIEKAGALLPDVATGTFQAMMDVRLVNEGPVTILLDSKREF